MRFARNLLIWYVQSMDFRKSPSLLLSMNHILRNYKSIIASRENLFRVGIGSFDEENIMVLVSS